MAVMKIPGLLPALILAACAAATPTPRREPLPPAVQRDLERFSSFHVGYYESVEQDDRRGDNQPMVLRISRPWPEREKDGEFWFYMEYARPGQDDKPFRQRLVRADQGQGEYMQEIEYALPGDPRALVGAWRDGKAFANVDPWKLKEIPGCRAQLGTMQITMFGSGTVGTECRHAVPPGMHRKSEYFQTSSSMRLWDRAVDAQGKPAPGSPPGPVELRRLSQVPR